jgi:hypothetical protein
MLFHFAISHFVQMSKTNENMNWKYVYIYGLVGAGAEFEAGDLIWLLWVGLSSWVFISLLVTWNGAVGE